MEDDYDEVEATLTWIDSRPRSWRKILAFSLLGVANFLYFIAEFPWMLVQMLRQGDDAR